MLGYGIASHEPQIPGCRAGCGPLSDRHHAPDMTRYDPRPNGRRSRRPHRPPAPGDRRRPLSAVAAARDAAGDPGEARTAEAATGPVAAAAGWRWAEGRSQPSEAMNGKDLALGAEAWRVWLSESQSSSQITSVAPQKEVSMHIEDAAAFIVDCLQNSRPHDGYSNYGYDLWLR